MNRRSAATPCDFCPARAVYHVACEDSVLACRRHLTHAADRALNTGTDLRVLVDWVEGDDRG